MTVDRARVRDLSDRLERETQQLRELARRERDDLLGDRVALVAIKYGFVVAIEICIDVAQDLGDFDRFRREVAAAVLANGT